MAFTMANRGLYTLLTAATSGSTDIRALVFKTTTPTVAAIRDMNFVSVLLGATTEAAAAGYARLDLASVALVESDASDNVVLSAAAPTTAAIAPMRNNQPLALLVTGGLLHSRVAGRSRVGRIVRRRGRWGCRARR